MADTTEEAVPKGRGWWGNSEGHAKAGREGGKASGGNFKYNRKRASDAGKKKRPRTPQ